jgi:hypothetical protein
MTASVLSPLALPFHPAMGEIAYPTIFNNGIPSMIVSSTEHDFLASMITDETLDEAFPPTAQDAAELEAVEVFVALMANLELLEEQEEATVSLHTAIKKRWEARRGLAGKPRTPTNRIKHVSHGEPRPVEIQDSLVLEKRPVRMENHMLAHGRFYTGGNPRMDTTKTGGTKHQRNMPIQQPRKHS